MQRPALASSSASRMPSGARPPLKLSTRGRTKLAISPRQVPQSRGSIVASSSRRISRASPTRPTVTGTFLPTSEASSSIWTIFAPRANAARFPVTRSSKRSPIPMIRSACWIARFTCTSPCMPGMPRCRGCDSGNALIPSSVVMTGMPVRSARVLSSSYASPRMTPWPAMISGRSARPMSRAAPRTMAIGVGRPTSPARRASGTRGAGSV